MEKITTHIVLPEELELKLKEKISHAKLHALTNEELVEIRKKLTEINITQQNRELTDDEEKQNQSFREKIDQASILVDTIAEARRVMEIMGVDNDSLVDTLSHENAHANKTMQLGANFHGYCFTLVEEEDGSYTSQPMAMTSMPAGLDDKKYEEIETQIIMAPDEYGNKMSEDDIEQLRIRYGK